MAGYCELKGMNDLSFTDFDCKVLIVDYEETVNVLDGEAAGRSKLRGRMIRDPLGAFIGHKITFLRDGSEESFDSLWDWLKAHCVEDYVYLRAADGQTIIDHKVYYTSFGRKIESVDDNGVRHWGSISVNFIPIEPDIVPS